MELREMDNEKLAILHRQATRLAALVDNGLRIGISTPLFIQLRDALKARLEKLEAVYFERNPQERLNRQRQFLAFCDREISAYDDFIFPKEADVVKQSISVDYNSPEAGIKAVQIKKQVLNDRNELTDKCRTSYMAMDGNDDLFALLENALDEFAKGIPAE